MLSDFEKTLLQALFHADEGKKNPEGVTGILQQTDNRISLWRVRSSFKKLIILGYIHQKFETTPLADREIGTER